MFSRKILRSTFALLAMALVFSLLDETHASATKSAVLRDEQIDGVHKERHVALVSINSRKNILNVSILEDRCGRYAVPRAIRRCLAMPRLVERFELRFSKSVGTCGSVTYEATNNPGAGESLTQIAFVDHSKNTCSEPSAGLHEIMIRIDSHIRYYAVNVGDTEQLR